jgi:hypothetical protein
MEMGETNAEFGMRNSECGIVRVETARGRIVVFQYKKRLWWALFIDAIFA